MKKKWSLFITCLSKTQTALLCGLGWRFGIKRADMYGTMENCLTVLFPSSGSATCQDVFMKMNASKSWKMAGNSRNVARKTNISSVRDPKVSCSCWELGIKNVGEAPIVRGMTGVQVIFDHLGRFPNTLKWSALEQSRDHMKEARTHFLPIRVWCSITLAVVHVWKSHKVKQDIEHWI